MYGTLSVFFAVLVLWEPLSHAGHCEKDIESSVNPAIASIYCAVESGTYKVPTNPSLGTPQFIYVNYFMCQRTIHLRDLEWHSYLEYLSKDSLALPASSHAHANPHLFF